MSQKMDLITSVTTSCCSFLKLNTVNVLTFDIQSTVTRKWLWQIFDIFLTSFLYLSWLPSSTWLLTWPLINPCAHTQCMYTHSCTTVEKRSGPDSMQQGSIIYKSHTFILLPVHIFYTTILYYLLSFLLPQSFFLTSRSLNWILGFRHHLKCEAHERTGFESISWGFLEKINLHPLCLTAICEQEEPVIPVVKAENEVIGSAAYCTFTCGGECV